MNKIKESLYAILLVITALTGVTSCKGDDDKNNIIDNETKNATPVNKWIESTMRENYLWYSDIPTGNKLNGTADPETFFNSLLSNNDGNEYSDGTHYHYSYIENTASTTKSISNIDYSYGFEFEIYSLTSSNAKYAAHLLYVAHNTPASDAELKRGDWIFTINGDSITANNIETLRGSTAISIGVAKYDNSFPKSTTVQLGSARKIEDDPVHYHNIILSNKGKRVGYLVYNHFTAGKTDKDSNYNDELIDLSKTFSGNVDEFVLDLRYNNGGLITCAQLLSTMLTPKEHLGKIFCTLEYNDKNTFRNHSYKFDSSILKDGINIGLASGRIFVLVSSETASASELVINCLKPYMDVVLIGEKTEGKNVGSVSYTDDKYPWHLQPIVCKIYNANSESEYGKVGFTPKYVYNEAAQANLNQFLAFGNPSELLLGKALSIIDGTYASASTKTTTTRGTLNLKKVASSLDRKASSGVIIDQK